jgi:Cu+-exporting ATPase
VTLRFDPVCAMVISPGRARACLPHEGTTYYFCSVNCRECFERDPDRYLAAPALFFGAGRHGREKGVRQG